MKPRKVVENFTCEVCKERVVGDGYTDHCPKCLFGKHVDYEVPGDRVSDCGGLMEPKEVIYEKGEYKIFYKCTKCRHDFWVKAGKGDDKEKLSELL